MSNQVRAAERDKLVATRFAKRNEPNFASGNIVSLYSQIYGLRGLWTFGSFDENGDVFDMSEQDRTLSYVGDPVFNRYSLAPYAELDGTGDWFSRADEAGLDILGSEAYVDSGIQGITLAGWAWFDNAAGAVEGFMTKWAGVGQRSYSLRRNAAGNAQFEIIDGGAASRIVAGAALAVDTWYFLWGQLDRTNDLVRVGVNGVEATAAVPGATVIANSNAPFQIGAENSVQPMTGRVSNCVLATTALSEAFRQSLYHNTRSLYA